MGYLTWNRLEVDLKKFSTLKTVYLMKIIKIPTFRHIVTTESNKMYSDRFRC